MNPTNNIIGPFDHETWNALRFFRSDINEMKNARDGGDYTEAIAKEQSLYQEFMKPFKNS